MYRPVADHFVYYSLACTDPLPLKTVFQEVKGLRAPRLWCGQSQSMQ